MSTPFVEFMLGMIKDSLLLIDKTDQVSDQVSDQVKKAIITLADKRLSATQIMTELNLSHRPTFRKNYLFPAMDEGILEMTIPEKPQSSKQKYRLTPEDITLYKLLKLC